MKKSIILLSTIASIIVSCTAREKPVNVIALTDFSDSRDSAVIAAYGETIKRSLLRNMGFRDRLVVLPIDFQSQAASEEVFRIDFGTHDYSNEFAGLQKSEIEAQNHQDSVTSAIVLFDSSFAIARNSRTHFTQGTDIIGALKQAQKYIVPTHRTVIVIFSDMLHYTSRLTMNFEDSLTSVDDIPKYLEKVEIVDLSGAEILVYTGNQSKITPEKFALIQSFWEKYFLACHAIVRVYSSGGASLLEEVIGHN